MAENDGTGKLGFGVDVEALFRGWNAEVVKVDVGGREKRVFTFTASSRGQKENSYWGAEDHIGGSRRRTR